MNEKYFVVRHLTNIKGGVFSFSKVINVGDAQRCDWGFSNSPQSVPQEHVDPHAGTRLLCTGCIMTQAIINIYDINLVTKN